MAVYDGPYQSEGDARFAGLVALGQPPQDVQYHFQDPDGLGRGAGWYWA